MLTNLIDRFSPRFIGLFFLALCAFIMLNAMRIASNTDGGQTENVQANKEKYYHLMGTAHQY